MPELRENTLTGGWVVIAAQRAMRPESFTREPEPAKSEHLAGCPFCEGNEGQTPPEVYALRPKGGITNQPGWQVRVVPNKFPAFLDLEPETTPSSSKEDLFVSIPAIGRHEVIVHGPEHNKTMAEMAVRNLADVLNVYQTRLNDLTNDTRLASAIIIVNQGREAGASIEHPHSQLFAIPLVAPLIAREVERIKKFKESGGGCLVCDMIEAERSLGQRVVTENKDFIVFCPFASRTPFEMYIMPKSHQAEFNLADGRQIGSLATIIKLALSRLRDRLGNPPYNMYLHTRPFRENSDYHWHLALLPKTSTIAGFEFGTGIVINVTEPEDAAAFLR